MKTFIYLVLMKFFDYSLKISHTTTEEDSFNSAETIPDLKIKIRNMKENKNKNKLKIGLPENQSRLRGQKD